jgi:DNA-binding XRE family transcriptional regulator
MAKTKTGRSKEHIPTDKSRAEVAALTSFGNTQEEVASYIDISVDTLAKYYRDELDNSVVRANAKVAAKLFRKAVDGDDIKAQIFWLKTRAKWRETNDDKSTTDKIVDRLIDKLVE